MYIFNCHNSRTALSSRSLNYF